MAVFKEFVDSRSPSSAGFSFEGGRAIFPLLMEGTEDIYEGMVQILGDCIAGGDGRLTRDLPLAHPKYPWLFAERISEIRGLGQYTLTPSLPILEAPPLDFYAEYEQYLLNVEFSSRPYAVLSDDRIQVYEDIYVDESGSPVNYRYANEWERFTDWEVKPNSELITAQSGSAGVFKFRDQTNADPDGFQFTGRPFIRMPSAAVVYRWFGVPLSYLASRDSHLVRWTGYVNQTQWDGWEAGTLLYLACNVLRRYTPIVPELEIEPGHVSFSIEKLCDLELIFSYTPRVVTNPPTPANGNWIAAGHNVVPWFKTRKFYYVSVDDASANNQYPLYPSIPFQMLFTNPDI